MPNDGFKDLGTVITFKNFEDLAEKASKLNINLLVVGPEMPLIEGIVDIFSKYDIPAIGPTAEWAMLEGSKTFAKEFMLRNNLPTARYITINDKNEIDTALEQFSLPVVLKADGLAAGKGVAIVDDYKEAKNKLCEYLDGKFGDASKKIIIEEYLKGEEISLIALWDGLKLLPFITARDYKRLLDNDLGPNTGGMGSYCPVELTNKENKEITIYVKNLEKALKKESAQFAGIVYSGLILTSKGIQVLEYNMRFGDPETQALMMHLKSDLLKLFNSAVNQKLSDVSLEWHNGSSFCLVVAANGYPGQPVKGGEIKYLDNIKVKFGVETFFASINNDNSRLIACGGRVLSICKTGDCPQVDVYKAADELDYPDKIFRKDIGRSSLFTT